MKKWSNIFIKILCLGMILIMGLGALCACDGNWTKYSEEEHIARVASRVEKRYMTGEYNITDYDIYPLYDENEELSFFIVEFEPSGFVCVKINKDYSWILRTALQDMYTRYEYLLDRRWKRYRFFSEGMELYPNSCWAQNDRYYDYEDECCEVDESGQPIEHNVSFYKAAGVLNERKYMFTIKTQMGTCHVPAVKRGDMWLNLISMEKFDLNQLSIAERAPHAPVHFSVKADFNL